MAKLSELGVDFQHWCFACGQLNPGGLHLEFRPFEIRTLRLKPRR